MKFLIRIVDDQFVKLFEIPTCVIDLDPEVTPMTFNSLKTSVLMSNKEQIVLKAVFESGYTENDYTQPLNSKTDTVTFDYAAFSRQFIWKSSTNPEFQEFWTQQKDYQSLK